ncbi:OmpA family protein, partial [Bdellovibrionales bacterium]|nr:OmpA family protein [Bdellovibrionales bacterium]
DIATERISGHFSTKGSTELRPSLKYRFWKKEKKGMAVVASLNHNLVKNNIYLGKNVGPTINLEWIYSQEIKYGKWGVNLGRRWRSKGEALDPLVPPLDDAWLYSFAFSHYFTHRDLKVVGEVYGSFPVSEGSQSQLSYSEALLALKYDHKENLAFLSGLGGEISRGSSTPDWRFFVGLNYNFSFEKEPELEKVEVTPEEVMTIGESVEEPEIELEPDLEPEVEPEVEEPPPPPPVKKEVPKEVLILRNINFKSGSHRLVYGRVKYYLKKLSRKIKKQRDFKRVEIIGHTDSIGSDEYNMKLSYRRARTIKRFFIKQGIERRRIQVKGRGESDPVADNSNYQGRRRNRRVEFRFY